MPTAEAAPAGRTTTTAVDNAAADEFLGLQALFVALSDHARDHNVPDRAIQEFAGWASPDMITRYDKRRSAIEKSAAHAIVYGAEDREIPAWVNRFDPPGTIRPGE